MLNITEDQINSIRDQLSSATPIAVGYRLIVKPITARKGMEASEANEFKALAAAGFEVKDKNQQSKETQGSDVGIIVSAGPESYDSGSMKDKPNWAEVGDVVIMGRYEGKRVELPPGSGEFYQFINDNDILGIYKGVEV